MEQARTLEEIQLKMKQELLDRQTQLMEQLQHLDSLPASSLPNGGTAAVIMMQGDNGVTDPAKMSDASGPTASTTSNGHSAYHNGVHNGRADPPEVTGTQSLSADESNTSQGSSHDTWDSTNAFTHERPVLTGSERSTPTPTQAALPAADSSNDLELLSQSVHIPVDFKDAEADNSDSRLVATQPVIQPTTANGFMENDLIDLSARTSELGDSTPRNIMVIPLTIGLLLV